MLEATKLTADYFYFQFIAKFSDLFYGTILLPGDLKSHGTGKLTRRRRFLQCFLKVFHPASLLSIVLDLFSKWYNTFSTLSIEHPTSTFYFRQRVEDIVKALTKQLAKWYTLKINSINKDGALMKNFLKGIFLGFALILPGMSGGTAFLILGMYRQVLKDLSSFNLKPYLILGVGTGAGLLLWSFSLNHLLFRWPELVYSFLLGAVWASAPLIFRNSRKISFLSFKGLYSLLGVACGWFLAARPLSEAPVGESISLPMVFTSGIIASATMLIPGLSGSTALVIMGVYHHIINILSNMQLLPLLVFGTGCIVGVFGLARLLLFVYNRYTELFAFFIAGLIIGSGRILFPEQVTFPILSTAMAGALIVTISSLPRQNNSTSSPAKIHPK